MTTETTGSTSMAANKHQKVTALTALIALSGTATALVETLRSRDTDSTHALAVARQEIEREYADKDRDKELGNLRTDLTTCLDITTTNRRRLDKLETVANLLSRDQDWKARKTMGERTTAEPQPRLQTQPSAKQPSTANPTKPKRASRHISNQELQQKVRDLGLAK